MINETMMQNFGYTFWTIEENIDGLTQDDSLVQPPGGGNCLNWVLGHITSSRNGLHGLLGLELPWQDERRERYGRGSSTITNAAEALSIDDMRAVLKASQEQMMPRLEKITAAELGVECDHLVMPGEKSTVGLMLAALQFHEAYHAGQLGVLRRLAGKEGKLK